MRLKKLSYVYLALIFFLAFFQTYSYSQRLGFHFEGKRKKVTIPFKTFNNLIVLDIVLNGSIPLRFILDSGVRSTIIIQKSITDILGVQYARSLTLYGVGKKLAVEAWVAQNIILEMPGVKANRMSLLVLQEDYLKLRNNLGTEVHGILGYDLFSRFVVEINYLKEHIVLYDPSEFKVKRKFRPVKLEIPNSKPFITIPVQLSDTTEMQAKLLIDTGASHALMLHQDTDPRISIPQKNIRSKLGRGLTGEFMGFLGRIQSCEIAGTKLNDLVVSYPDEFTFLDSLSINDRNGTMGGEILNRFTVVMDYFDSTMYFKKNHKIRQPFDYNMSGLEFIAEGRNLDNFVVQEVRKGSPAFIAGIRPGDYIVEINGNIDGKLTLTEMYHSLNSKEGKQISVLIDRGGVRFYTKFKLRREI